MHRWSMGKITKFLFTNKAMPSKNETSQNSFQNVHYFAHVCRLVHWERNVIGDGHFVYYRCSCREELSAQILYCTLRWAPERSSVKLSFVTLEHYTERKLAILIRKEFAVENPLEHDDD